MSLILTTGEDDDNRRLDRVLRKALPDLPLSAIHRLLRQSAVLVNGEAATGDYRLQSGQTIMVKGMGIREQGLGSREQGTGIEPPFPNLQSLFPLFEGEGLLFINKPSGLSVHGRDSLEELVRAYLTPKMPPSLSFKPGPLHRLDKPSSGVIAFSTNIVGARVFSALMRERKIKKQYLAIVEGVVSKIEFWRDELVRDSLRKKTFAHGGFEAADGKPAITRIRPLMHNEKATLILAEIETGRTHQIRAQAASRGHPLLGDKKYGGAALHGGFLLHAWRLEFPEEARGFLATLPLLIEAPVPENFQKKIRELFRQNFNNYHVGSSGSW